MNYFEKFKQIFTEAANDSDGLKEGGSITVGINKPREDKDLLLFTSSSYLDSTGTIIYVWYMGGHKSATVEISGNDGHKYIFEGSMNLQTWSPISMFRRPSYGVDHPFTPYEFIPSYSNILYAFNSDYRYVRIRKTQNNSGSTTSVCRFSINLSDQLQDLNIKGFGAYPLSCLTYSPLAAITSAAAQTVVASTSLSNDSLLNYVQYVKLTNAGDTGSVVRLLAGAGGLEKLRFYVPPGATIPETFDQIIPFSRELIQIVVDTVGASIYPIIKTVKGQG